MEHYIYLKTWKSPTGEFEDCITRHDIKPDPKRPGMYITTRSNCRDGFKRKNIGLYGKSNQAEILEMIELSKKQ